MPPLWRVDEQLFHAIHVGLRRDWLDPWARAFSFSGLGYIQILACLLAASRRKIGLRASLLILAVCSIAVGFLEKSPLTSLAMVALGTVALFLSEKVAVCCLAAICTSGLFRLLVVPLVDRQRPSNLPYSAPLENVFGHSSFPSGHATTSFAVATVLCWAYAKTSRSGWAWGGLAYAFLVALARVYTGVHYPLDVMAGALLGAAFGSLCFWSWDKKGWLGERSLLEREVGL